MCGRGSCPLIAMLLAALALALAPSPAFADAHGISYLGWTWDTWDCASGPALISNYDGTPTAFGIGFRNHLALLVKPVLSWWWRRWSPVTPSAIRPVPPLPYYTLPAPTATPPGSPPLSPWYRH